MATPSSRLRSQLERALHQRYRNRRLACHLYCALANREPLKARQEILLMLARNAERSAATDAIRLLRLNLPVPDEPVSSHSLWRQFLLFCGLRVTMLWLEWQEKRAARRCLQVFDIDR
ncbi:MAG: hypothetical protein IGR93_15725 [Hydrococcus sp. C42_A2020_068]|nr:hypothetical protein [Hydrococcus sp. C42_A2020_068]